MYKFNHSVFLLCLFFFQCFLSVLSYGLSDEESDADKSESENSDDEMLASRVAKKQKSFEKVELDILAHCEDLERNYAIRERLWKNDQPKNHEVKTEEEEAEKSGGTTFKRADNSNDIMSDMTMPKKSGDRKRSEEQRRRSRSKSKEPRKRSRSRERKRSRSREKQRRKRSRSRKPRKRNKRSRSKE